MFMSPQVEQFLKYGIKCKSFQNRKIILILPNDKIE